MSLLSVASGTSQWRGYEYFKNKKVIASKNVAEGEFEGTVKGENEYQVKIDINHPRKSTCSCPLTNGRRLVCKHMVALYFSVFPKEAETCYEQVIEWEEQEEKRQEDLQQKVIEYVKKMRKEDLQNELLNILFDSPDWVYDRFVRDHDLDY